MRFLRWVWALIRNIADNDLHNHAAEMAYFAIMSVFPFFLLLLSAVAFLDVPDLFDQTMNVLESVAPQAVVQILEGTIYNVTHVQQINLLSITAVVAVWWSLGAMSSTIRGLNKVFGMLDPRHYVHFFGLTILLTLLLGSLLVVAIVLIMLGPVVHNAITSRWNPGWLGDILVTTFRWFVVGFFLLVGHSGIYWLCPAVKRKFRLVTPGSLVSAFGWVIVSYGLQTYLRHFNNYNKVYGSLGAVILTLFWFYLMSFVLLLGGQIDAMLHPEFRVRLADGAKPSYVLSRFPFKFALTTLGIIVFAAVVLHFIFKHDLFTPSPHELRGPIGNAVQEGIRNGTQSVNHDKFAAVLRRVVDDDGNVDFRALRDHPDDLNGYLEDIDKLRLDTVGRAHLHATMLNLYNATVMRLVAQTDRIETARDIQDYQTRRTVRLMGERISLDNLEHAILRSYFRDERNHFAIYRGMRRQPGMPRLRQTPFDGGTLEKELENATEEAIAAIETKNDVVQLPRLFHDYQKDFAVDGKLTPFLKKYAGAEVKACLEKLGDSAIVFTATDWTLNAKK